MNNIVLDNWKLILSHSNDREKLNFLLTSKKIMESLGEQIYFDEEVDINKILKSQFFLNFTNLIMDEYIIYTDPELYGDRNHALVLPRNIKRIRFVDSFNRSVDNIPSTVTHLIFGFHFNQYINGCIPTSVTHLIFGNNFNKSIFDCIPSSITYLKFGYSFNRPIENCIPPSVTHLMFGGMFNYLIKGLPSSITYLEFGDRFDQSIKELPSLITHLTLGYWFDKPIKNNIPSSITHLTLSYNYPDADKVHIPTTVKHLKFV